MQFLFEEIKAASQDPSLAKQQREAFKFKRYLVLTRVYADDNATGGAEAGPSSSKKQKVMHSWPHTFFIPKMAGATTPAA